MRKLKDRVKKAAKIKPGKKKLSDRLQQPLPSEDLLTSELGEDLLSAWKKLRAFALSLGEQKVYTSHKAIMFSRRICYFFVRPKRNYLEVCLFLPEAVNSPMIKRCQRVSTTRMAHTIHMVHEDLVEEPLTEWLRESFSLSK